MYRCGFLPTNSPSAPEVIPITYNIVCNWEIWKSSDRSFNSHSFDRVGQLCLLFVSITVCVFIVVFFLLKIVVKHT